MTRFTLRDRDDAQNPYEAPASEGRKGWRGIREQIIALGDAALFGLLVGMAAVALMLKLLTQ